MDVIVMNTAARDTFPILHAAISWASLLVDYISQVLLDQHMWAYLTNDCKACSMPAFGLSASSSSQSTGLGAGDDFKGIGIVEDWISSLCDDGVKSTVPEVLVTCSALAGFDLSTIISLELCMAISRDSEG